MNTDATFAATNNRSQTQSTKFVVENRHCFLPQSFCGRFVWPVVAAI